MIEEPCEPWTNGHQLAADVVALLERLTRGTLSLDAVHRSLLRDDEIAPLLSEPERHSQESDLLAGLLAFLGRLGRSRAFGDAIARGQERAERFREQLVWADVPEPVRRLCERRAATVLDRAVEEGFVAGPAPYRITAEGRAFLARGGYETR